MKHLLLSCVAVLLVGCIDNPGITITAPDGTKTVYSTGRNLMAEVDEQVSELEAPGGIHLRHMVKRQDATRVPIDISRMVGMTLVSYLGYLNNLAEQVTAQMAAGEITKREGQAILGRIESERIAAGVSGATEFNPNIALPIRK